MSDATYRWECVCGWSIERDKQAANLPEESNGRIARIAASAHEELPLFGEEADEAHAVSPTDTDHSTEGSDDA